MSKTAPRFYADPTQDPAFEGLQRHWYLCLKNEDFQDIEDSSRTSRPLKEWSRLPAQGFEAIQPENSPIVSSLPESSSISASHFVHHPEFLVISKLLCQHGNSRLTLGIIELIWLSHCEGKSERKIEKQTGISDTRVRQAINRIMEWMGFFMDTPQEDRPLVEEPVQVIVRKALPEDTGFIYASWRNALWFEEKREDRFSEHFFRTTTRAIKILLSRGSTQVQIACLRNDPDFIVGYSVMTGKNLEWIYIKAGYRKQGIGTLLSKGFLTISKPLTRVGLDIAQTHQLKENGHGSKNRSDSRKEKERPKTQSEAPHRQH